MPATEYSRNIVAKNSKIKVKKHVVPKVYIPGTYEKHHPSQCQHKLKERPIHLQRVTALEGKEIYKVVERDNIRDLVVPTKDPNAYPTIWKDTDYHRLQRESKVKTIAERDRELAEKEAEKKRLMEETDKRKARLREIDRKFELEKGKIVEFDDHVKEDTKVLEKYKTAKHEDEEEIRKANRIILSTKCQIIRFAQINEKQEIERELREEQNRLAKMINDNDEKALKLEEQEREHKRQLNKQHAIELKNQLAHREMTKTLEAERIEEEAKMMAKAYVAVNQEKQEVEKRRREKIEKTKRELQQANELSEYFKKLEFEERRIADLKVQEYMRQKRERDEQIKREKRIEAELKERERERLLELQKNILETKASQTSQELRREQEEKEREFRRKEKEAAQKRKKMMDELTQARNAQLEEVKKARAIEIAREEAEYLKTCEKMKKELDEEQKRIEKQQKDSEKYRAEIIGQMNEREQGRRELLRKAKNDLHAKQEEEKNRIRAIRSVVLQKIQNMKDNKLPDIFIKDVERQLMNTIPNYK